MKTHFEEIMEDAVMYLQAANDVKRNGFTNDRIEKAVKWLDEAKRRLDEKDGKQDRFYQSCLDIHNSLIFVSGYRDRIQKCVEMLGLNGPHYTFTYKKKYENPARKYVEIMKVYEDDSTSFERFYVPDSVKTVKEAWGLAEKQFKGLCDVVDCYGIYEDEPYTTYEADMLYHVKHKKEE